MVGVHESRQDFYTQGVRIHNRIQSSMDMNFVRVLHSEFGLWWNSFITGQRELAEILTPRDFDKEFRGRYVIFSIRYFHESSIHYVAVLPFTAFYVSFGFIVAASGKYPILHIKFVIFYTLIWKSYRKLSFEKVRS